MAVRKTWVAMRTGQRVIRVAGQTSMPTELFDALMASLDIPDRAPRLKKEAVGPRSFERA